MITLFSDLNFRYSKLIQNLKIFQLTRLNYNDTLLMDLFYFICLVTEIEQWRKYCTYGCCTRFKSIIEVHLSIQIMTIHSIVMYKIHCYIQLFTVYKLTLYITSILKELLLKKNLETLIRK